MTEKEVLQEFVDAMRILSMRCRLSVQEIADILNPIGDKARKVLDRNENVK